VDDQGLLLDQRQTLLDAIGQNGTGCREQDSATHRKIVAGNQSDQGEGLASGGPERAKELVARSTPGGIHSGSDEDHRADQRRPAHG
jgi:hypothetical protein